MYSVGDKVKASQFYQEHYSNFSGNGVVVEVCPTKTVKKSMLSKEDGSYARYKDLYGDLNEYKIESFLVKFDIYTDPALVSIFGIEPI
jgi:hypothetical protein